MIIFTSNVADISPVLAELAVNHSNNQTIHRLNLGHSMSTIRKSVHHAQMHGEWIIIDDVDLCAKFRHHFDHVLQMISVSSPNIDGNFRVFIVVSSTVDLPVHMLHMSVRHVVDDDHTSLEDKDERSHSNDTVTRLLEANSANEDAVRAMLSLYSLNAMIHERRHFKFYGWNVPYEFIETDLMCALWTTEVMMQRSRHTNPWPELNCIIDDVAWGAQIVDENDVRRLRALSTQLYQSPPSHHSSVELPKIAPELKQMNDQQIAMDRQRRALYFINSVRKVSSDCNISDAIAVNGNEKIEEILKMIMLKTPLELIQSASDESLTPVDAAIHREATVVNHLIMLIKNTTASLSKACSGLEVTRSESEVCLRQQLLLYKVPNCWRVYGFTTPTTLAKWLERLQQRHQFISNWMAAVAPPRIWLGGLSFSHSFLIAVRQMYARKNSISLIDVALDHVILDAEVRTYHLK